MYIALSGNIVPRFQIVWTLLSSDYLEQRRTGKKISLFSTRDFIAFIFIVSKLKSIPYACRPSSWNHSSQWQLTSDNNQLNLVILGSNGLSEEFACEIRAQTEDDEVEIDCQMYTLGYRVIDGDVGLPHNSFTTSDFMPHGNSTDEN